MANVFDSQGTGSTRTFDAQIYAAPVVVVVPPVVVPPVVATVPQEYFLATISAAPIYFRGSLLENNVYSA